MGAMPMSRSIVFVFVACLIAQASFAGDRDNVVGTWKLVSYEIEVQATGQRSPAIGEKPIGYATSLSTATKRTLEMNQ
jgi:hypothetical protein